MPLTTLIEFQDGAKLAQALTDAPEAQYVFANSGGYGFIASSDHLATHNSYTCVWAEAFTNQALFEAIAQRRCYAATDRIVCRMHMGPHMMGSQFAAATVPPLEIEVAGTAEVERIDVVKDNRVVYCHQPGTPSRQAAFQFQDTQAEPGTHYYYARVIQRDRNMAWLSPIWVQLKPAAGKD